MIGAGVKQDPNEDYFNPWSQLKDLEALIVAALVRHLPGLQVCMRQMKSKRNILVWFFEKIEYFIVA